MSHPEKAAAFISDEARTDWHDQALWFVRQKRDVQSKAVPEWEDLREAASEIKHHTLSRLDFYLSQFAEKAEANGVHVHWAVDANAHNEIVGDILKQHSVKRLVKSKSMLTEECGLNHYLEESGVEVIDTDLGERIVQFAKEAPSHIVMPAIHFKKAEIGRIFHDKLGTEEGADDPKYLTEAARQHLRAMFLSADAGLTGVNFAISETGGVVVCTNEGNADLGVHLAPLKIHSMGIEKVIPGPKELSVFLRLLARSATGQPLTTYTSHFHRPRSGTEMHIVIVDNGRSRQLGSEDFRNSLKCIRCGACLNTCPVYRRSGGHSYDYTIPGPIGSILSPNMDPHAHKSLPFASTLCGSCSDVCPVKIDIHEQLYRWRQVLTEKGGMPVRKRFLTKAAARVLSSPVLYRMAGKTGRMALRRGPRRIVYSRLNEWGKDRELPVAPKESFRDWYIQHRLETPKDSANDE